MPTLRASERPPHLSQRARQDSFGGTSASKVMTLDEILTGALKAGMGGAFALSGTFGGKLPDPADTGTRCVALFLPLAGDSSGGAEGGTGAIGSGADSTRLVRAVNDTLGDWRLCNIIRLWLTSFADVSFAASSAMS